MKTVFVVMAMDASPYENDGWISSIFESEVDARCYLAKMEKEDEEYGYYYYTIKQWEVK